MSKFIAASRQAKGLDKMRILLEMRIQEVNEEYKKWAEVADKAKKKAKEVQNLIEELKTDVVEKNTRFDYLQKKNNELSTLLSKAKEDVVTEFKVSKHYTNLLDTNYAAGFEDFKTDAMEKFPKVDFSSIKLNLVAATNYLLQTSSKDVNVEDDATTLPLQDDPNVNAPSSQGQDLYI